MQKIGKRPSTLIQELKKELRYHQMMVRVDIRAAKAGIRRCKEIAEQMRKLQRQQRKK